MRQETRSSSLPFRQVEAEAGAWGLQGAAEETHLTAEETHQDRELFRRAALSGGGVTTWSTTRRSGESAPG